jgi:hypothetical protein
MSGTRADCPQLAAVPEFVREGDVWSSPGATEWGDRCASFCPPTSVTHRPVQKSPSLTIAEAGFRPWFPASC